MHSWAEDLDWLCGDDLTVYWGLTLVSGGPIPVRMKSEFWTLPTIDIMIILEGKNLY